jgi:hypothetical protein
MSLLLAALLLAAPDPAVAATDAAQQPVTVKREPQQVCEYIEITGSRTRKRVCHNADGEADLMPGVSNSLGAKSKVSLPPAAATPQ